jgi:nucleoside-diphosphate-sugar epimerase
MSNDNGKSALVIGATGGVGGAVADRLLSAGWRVRALHRDPETARRNSDRAGLEWIKGDAMAEGDVVVAAEGVQLVIHGANPPGYRNWRGLQMPMLNASIAAAKTAGARLIFPGTVYNYGPDAFPSLTEASPQNPATRKGAIRVQMEAVLARAAAEDGLRVLIVRCGDFFGPKPGNNWLSQGLVKPGRPLSAITYPGPLGVRHAWAYLPDLAETMVRLVEREAELAVWETFHMRGHTLSGHDLVAALEAIAGRKLAVSGVPWLAVRGLAPFNETFREMLEMRYLWETPVLLDNARLTARLGAEPHTPVVDALRTALAGLNALPTPAAMAA